MPRLGRPLRAFVERSTDLLGDDFRTRSIARQRRAYLEFCRLHDGPRPPGLQRSDRSVIAGNREIPLRVYRPGPAAPLPALLFCHGGGWIWGNLESHDDLCAEIAARTEAVLIAVDYRLAPEHPYPAALDDADLVLRSLSADPASFGALPSPPVLCGDSAGANLVAALAIRSRDQGGPRLAGQALIYPMLADPTRGFPDGDGASDLDRDDIRHFWRCYVGHAGAPGAYAAPLHAERLDGLPPAFVLTAEHDPLRADGRAYAARLTEAGVPTAWHDGRGLIHGCLRIWRESPAVARALDTLTSAIRGMLVPAA